MLRQLSYDEIAYIYHRYMVEDFPQDELKPLVNIEKMWKENCYCGYGYYLDNHLAGYALFSNAPGTDYVLLDYLAIMKEQRGTGIGSIFLLELQAIFMDKTAILIETESIESGITNEIRQQRKRRDSFYLKVGAKPYALVGKVYAVEYRIWNLQTKHLLTENECSHAYDEIYHYMLSEKGYCDYFQIEKRDYSSL